MLTYDDSAGWYDHVMPPVENPSADPLAGRLNGIGVCGHGQPLAGHRTGAATGPGSRSC
jgi:phospholipase C